MSAEVWIITAASFLASFINAAFATGGVYVMLLASVWVLPVSAAVPLQSAFAVGSLLARIGFFWSHIHWPIAMVFILGSAIGVSFGIRAFIALPETWILFLLGIVLLVLIWAPKPAKMPKIRHPFFYVGIVHSMLGATFGVGGVLQPFILRTNLKKLQITGTLAVCLLVLDAMKATGYVLAGFNYLEYLPHIVFSTIAGFLGTWAGRRITHQISEDRFRQVFRIFVTLIALRLVWVGLT